jgi:hypothetical protein
VIDEFEFKLDASEAIYSNFFRADFRQCWKTYELPAFEVPEIGEYLIYAVTNGSIGIGANTLPLTTMYICFDKHQRGMQYNTWTISIVYDDYVKHAIYKVRNIKLMYRRKPVERNETITIDVSDQQ